METNEVSAVIFDAKGQVLGRLASIAAKNLMQGRSVTVVNAAEAVITGSPKAIAARYKTRLDLQEKENPDHSPYWPRRPDMLVRRIIRGMLPYHKKPSGKSAYRRLRVYQGTPAALAGSKAVNLKGKDPRKIYVGSITIRELSGLLGYTKE